MKKLVSTTLVVVLIAAFALVVAAQKPKSKEDAFKEIATLSNTKKPEDAEKAYQLSKDFLARFGKDKKDESVGKIKKFSDSYREAAFLRSVDEKKAADAFGYGKDILADTPDDAAVMMNLAYAGYNAMTINRDKTFVDESINYAKTAVAKIEGGSTPKSFAPFRDKDDSMAFMYYIVGSLLLEKDPKEAASNIYKATTYPSTVKESPGPYYLIAAYYEDLYAKSSAAIKAKTLSDADFKAESAKINNIIERMMDAYARAYKIGQKQNNPAITEWKQRLDQIYAFKNKSTEGLNEFINYANTTKMQDPANF